MMVWSAIGYMSRSPLVHIDDTLNSARYTSGVLQSVALPLIRVQRNHTFQQNNVQPDVAGIEWTLLDTESVRLSPIENVWSMVA
ncbi:transposable element Tcb1 transposase [Trichonephila clavipes]|nr:transposable element Tcb1 transposase [Trichonephila clavipes]